LRREAKIAEREAMGFAKGTAEPERRERKERKERSDKDDDGFKRRAVVESEPQETFVKKEKLQKANGMQSENWDEAGF